MAKLGENANLTHTKSEKVQIQKVGKNQKSNYLIFSIIMRETNTNNVQTDLKKKKRNVLV